MLTNPAPANDPTIDTDVTNEDFTVNATLSSVDDPPPAPDDITLNPTEVDTPINPDIDLGHVEDDGGLGQTDDGGTDGGDDLAAEPEMAE
jgi:hypothetical protein